MSVHGRDGHRISEAERVEFIDVRIHGTRGVTLVDREDHRLPGTEQHRSDIRIGGSDPRGDIAYHDDDGSGVDGELRLMAHEQQDLVVRLRLDAAGVHHGESASGPVGFRIQSVARDAGRVFDDGQTFAGDPVEKHGLAHVRASDDSYQWFGHSSHLIFP